MLEIKSRHLTWGGPMTLPSLIAQTSKLATSEITMKITKCNNFSSMEIGETMQLLDDILPHGCILYFSEL